MSASGRYTGLRRKCCVRSRINLADNTFNHITALIDFSNQTLAPMYPSHWSPPATAPRGWERRKAMISQNVTSPILHRTLSAGTRNNNAALIGFCMSRDRWNQCNHSSGPIPAPSLSDNAKAVPMSKVRLPPHPVKSRPVLAVQTASQHSASVPQSKNSQHGWLLLQRGSSPLIDI